MSRPFVDLQICNTSEPLSGSMPSPRMSGTGIRPLGTIEQVGRDARSRAQLNP